MAARFALNHLATACIGMALLAACGGPTSSEDDEVASLDGESFRMVPVTIFDPMVDANAFSILVPRGWDYAGEVQWRHQMANLASASMTISNPKGGELLQIYPIIPFSFIQNPVVPIPIGTIYLGTEFRPPIQDPAVFLEQMVFPSVRGNATNASVINREGLTKVAEEIFKQRYGSDPNYGISAVKWTVQYTLAGREYEEAFYCAMSYYTSPQMPGSVIWQPEYIYSIRSFRGGMDRAEGLLQAVAASITLDMKWYGLYLQVYKLWQDGQMKAIQNAGELSRYISNVNNQITDIIVDGYNKRQVSEDRIYDQFSESIRGVETYDNPVTGRPVQLPSDFSHAWVSTTGEYFLTNSAGDNPNVGSTQDWQRLKTAP